MESEAPAVCPGPALLPMPLGQAVCGGEEGGLDLSRSEGAQEGRRRVVSRDGSGRWVLGQPPPDGGR